MNILFTDFPRLSLQGWCLASGVRRLSSSLRPPSSPVWRLASGIRRPSSSAFTLIEVLVAMTVLAVMVLMVANIFQSSSASWNIGTQKADMNTAARAALDFMARELASAVAGPIDKSVSGGEQYLTFRQQSLNELRFISLANDPDSNGRKRAVRGVFFWRDSGENRIMMSWIDTTSSPTNPPLDCYSGTPHNWDNSRSGGSMLITNVWNMYFYVYTNETELAAGRYINSPAIMSNELPICADVAIEMLSDDDMMRARALNSDQTEQEKFVARNSKLYSTRVYFQNRQGYGGR